MKLALSLRAVRKALEVLVDRPTPAPGDDPTSRRRALVNMAMALVLLGLMSLATACVGPTTPIPLVTPTPEPVLVDPTSGMVDAARTAIGWIGIGIVIAAALTGLVRLWAHRE